MATAPAARMDRRQFLGARRPLPRPARPVADLRPFVPTADDPWDAEKARHLIRRVAVGVRPGEVEAVVRLGLGEAVDRIVRRASQLPALPDPPWIGLRRPPRGAPADEADVHRRANDAARDEVYQGAFERLIGAGAADPLDRLAASFRERMTVFWSNHFVTEYREHTMAPWLWRHRALLREHALGDFRRAVHEVGTEPAMLAYLNGNENRVGRPNENYARELLELFTMGPQAPDGSANYAQADVVELARALTGWRTDPRAARDAYFDRARFDDGEKTVLGRTGRWGYDDVMPLLFDERAPQIAAFVARGLYREFVAEEPDAAVEAAIADALVAADFEVAPVVRALLQSAHLYDDANRGALIKSPIELLLGSAVALGVDGLPGDSWKRYRYQSSELGQDLINPPDVFGWRDGRAWIDTSTLTERAKRGRDEVWRHRSALAGDALGRPSASAARLLAAELAADLFARTPSAPELDALTEVLLAGTPEYAWDPADRGAERRVRELVQHLVSLPEYQLR